MLGLLLWFTHDGYAEQGPALLVAFLLLLQALGRRLRPSW